MTTMTTTGKNKQSKNERSAPTPRELRELAIKPRIKIFLSADIVGSTAFKQSFKLDDKLTINASVRERRIWQETIERFYDQMKDRFPVLWRQCFKRKEYKEELFDIVPGKPPRFWKTVGDEVIFWKELGHEAQLWALLQAWYEVIAEVRELLRQDEKGLDIKATIWLAEFPVRNCALPARVNPRKTAIKEQVAGVVDPLSLKSDKLSLAPSDRVAIEDSQRLVGAYYHSRFKNTRDVDFIGPGIDVGFRIAQFSSNRRMSISVDVAYLLAVSRINHFGTEKDFHDYTAEGKLRRAEAIHDAPGALLDYLKSLSISSDFACRGNGDCLKLSNIDIHYSGTAPLKGVLGNMSYPRLWISIVQKDSYEHAKQRMYLDEHMRREGPGWQQLLEYALAFYKERRGFVRAPVIVKDISDKDISMKWSSTCDETGFDTYKLAYDAALLYPSSKETEAA